MKLDLSSVIGAYCRPEKFSFGTLIAVKLKENISPACLRKAVDKSSSRYPYLAIELQKQPDGVKYEVVPNERPIVVAPATKKIDLCSEEANFHVQTVTYQDHSIFFNMHSAFGDDFAVLKWIKTVIYYYIEEKYQVENNSIGIRLCNTRTKIGENVDPLEKLFEEMKKSGEASKMQDDQNSSAAPFRFKSIIDESMYNGHPKVFYVQVPKKEFCAKFGDNEANVSSALLAMMYSVIHQEFEEKHPGETPDFEVVGGVAVNKRKCLGNFKSHCSCTDYVHISLPAKLKDMDVDAVATVANGQYLLKTDVESERESAKVFISGILSICDAKTFDEKCDLATSIVLKRFSSFSLCINYIGNVLFGSLDSYIEDIQKYSSFPAHDLADNQGAAKGAADYDTCDAVIEVIQLNDAFHITFSQSFCDESVVMNFVKQMKLKGMNPTIERLDYERELDIRQP